MSQPVLESDDLYERLGVARDADVDTIKKAYRALVRKHSPEHAPEEFKRIREAFETLGDPRSRREYDERPDPIVAQWLETAMHAMQAKQYDIAERYYKQVLVQMPHLGYVRNMLGLAFLYQDRPEEAARQFERLVREPEASPVWFGNAAASYEKLKRYADAEHMLDEAIKRASDPADYYLQLAEVQLLRSAPLKAVQTLERAIAADGQVDFRDFRYFTKLLQIYLRIDDHSGTQRTLSRMRDIAREDKDRFAAALELGCVAQVLISADRLGDALLVSELARELQPNDADYAALVEVARALKAGDLGAIEKLVASHASFAEGGWLNKLAPALLRKCTDRRMGAITPIKSAPPLRTINGVGTMLYGRRDYDSVTGSYIATLYFTFLFVPVLPLACYRVIARGANSWSFLGRAAWGNWQKWHAGIAAFIGFILLANGAFTNGNNSTASGSFTPNESTAPSYVVPQGETSPARGSLPSVQTQGTMSRSGTPGWYYLERGNVEELQQRIERLDREMNDDELEIQRLKSSIESANNGYGVYQPGDPLYESDLQRHNELVDTYNSLIVQRRTAYNEYEAALAAFNDHVDRYNAGARP